MKKRKKRRKRPFFECIRRLLRVVYSKALLNTIRNYSCWGRYAWSTKLAPPPVVSAARARAALASLIVINITLGDGLADSAGEGSGIKSTSVWNGRSGAKVADSDV